MDGIKGRIEKAAQSILENEMLTADLDDEAANVLLDWGVTCARVISQGTLGLDEMEAEDAMYQPMRATRRMMRAINKWVSRYEILGDDGHVEILEKIITQASIIYGSDYIPPTSDRRNAFLSEIKGSIVDIPQLITKIRNFVEGETSSASNLSVS